MFTQSDTLLNFFIPYCLHLIQVHTRILPGILAPFENKNVVHKLHHHHHTKTILVSDNPLHTPAHYRIHTLVSILYHHLYRNRTNF